MRTTLRFPDPTLAYMVQQTGERVTALIADVVRRTDCLVAVSCGNEYSCTHSSICGVPFVEERASEDESSLSLRGCVPFVRPLPENQYFCVGDLYGITVEAFGVEEGTSASLVWTDGVQEVRSPIDRCARAAPITTFDLRYECVPLPGALTVCLVVHTDAGFFCRLSLPSVSVVENLPCAKGQVWKLFPSRGRPGCWLYATGYFDEQTKLCADGSPLDHDLAHLTTNLRRVQIPPSARGALQIGCPGGNCLRFDVAP